MAANRDTKSRSTAASAPATPPYYIAEQPLFIGDQFGRAFNAGDRVPVEHVEQYGWADLVRLPDGYAVDQSPSEPDSAEGVQATSKEGEA